MDIEDLNKNPFKQFKLWFDLAKEKEINDPNAMALATVGHDGAPCVRIVLLKQWDEQGFVFYTNLNSQKGRQIEEHPKVAICLHWKSLAKQIRIEGEVEQVSDQQADDYYHSRPRRSQIGAWASKQSQPLDGKWTLEQRFKDYEQEFEGVDIIPRPEHWTGLRIKPTLFEFWSNGENRLHDRFKYTKSDNGAWIIQRYYP